MNDVKEHPEQSVKQQRAASGPNDEPDSPASDLSPLESVDEGKKHKDVTVHSGLLLRITEQRSGQKCPNEHTSHFRSVPNVASWQQFEGVSVLFLDLTVAACEHGHVHKEFLFPFSFVQFARDPYHIAQELRGDPPSQNASHHPAKYLIDFPCGHGCSHLLPLHPPTAFDAATALSALAMCQTYTECQPEKFRFLIFEFLLRESFELLYSRNLQSEISLPLVDFRQSRRFRNVPLRLRTTCDVVRLRLMRGVIGSR
ncbi:hypothetical protein F2P81_024936 [Scophthalmus maximus]|uniref:Uncharacterized protein n=1 Tax=Scophthalmus maximus TaxID=52904 RepID=A0A6A4RS02_SCOMX|nr:hypothetical protein F2P81_024936 [Scophthalmus maximus]